MGPSILARGLFEALGGFSNIHSRQFDIVQDGCGSHSKFMSFPSTSECFRMSFLWSIGGGVEAFAHIRDR